MSFKVVAFKRLGAVCYLPFIVTMAVTLNIYEIFSVKVNLKTGLEVTQSHSDWYDLKVWVEFPICLPCNLTNALSCIISEIKRDVGRKSLVFHTPLYSMPLLGGSPSEYCHPVWCGKTRMVGLPNREITLRIFVTV